jgi:hypothetical protein
MTEIYERPQVVPKTGNPGYRITWTLTGKDVQVLSRIEDGIKRGNK